MKDKTNVGFSVQKCVMETCRVGPTKNTIISKHLKQTYCYPKRIWQQEHLITMVHWTWQRATICPIPSQLGFAAIWKMSS